MVMQTLMPNQILRHIYRKGFLFFELFSAHLQWKFTKSVNKSKQNVSFKIQYGYPKNADSHAAESVEKVLKNTPREVISQNVTEICTFSLLFIFVQLVLLITFFGAFFKNFFNGFKIRVKSCAFLYLFWFKKKNFFKSY